MNKNHQITDDGLAQAFFEKVLGKDAQKDPVLKEQLESLDAPDFMSPTLMRIRQIAFEAIKRSYVLGARFGIDWAYKENICTLCYGVGRVFGNPCTKCKGSGTFGDAKSTGHQLQSRSGESKPRRAKSNA